MPDSGMPKINNFPKFKEHLFSFRAYLETVNFLSVSAAIHSNSMYNIILLLEVITFMQKRLRKRKATWENFGKGKEVKCLGNIFNFQTQAR